MDFDFLDSIYRKEPDAYITSKNRDSPLVVLEAGLSKREGELVKDAQLWLHGSRAAVSFVIIVVITEQKHISDDRQCKKRPLSEEEVKEQCSDGTQMDEGDITESEKYDRLPLLYSSSLHQSIYHLLPIVVLS